MKKIQLYPQERGAHGEENYKKREWVVEND